MSGHEETPTKLLKNDGKDMEGTSRDTQVNRDLLYVDEPERLFHQRRKEQAAREAADRVYQRMLQEEQAQANVNNPIYNPPPPPPAHNQGYGQQQHVPRQPLQQGNMQPNPRPEYRGEPSMKDMAVPTLQDQSWCINTDTDDDGFEVKTGVVHYLPKFAGLPGEVAIRHLKEFEGVCKTLKPYAAPEERFKLKLFPFSLTDIAKAWFLSLPAGSIRTWDQMQKKFIEKFYPAAKANQVRRELSVIKQGPNESTYDYLERFVGLEQSCCNLGIPDNLLVEYLLDGLRPLERMMLDAAAGGSVMNLTPTRVRELIRETAESARFREETTRREDTGRARSVSQVNASESRVAEELKEMREMMRMMMVAQASGVKACELCNLTNHRTDECPSLQSDNMADVNAMGGYQQFNNQPLKYGLAANGYSWKQGGFPNNQGANQQQQQSYQPPHQRQSNQNQPRRDYNQTGPSRAYQERPLEDIVRQMANQMDMYSKKWDSFMEVTGKQIGQLTADVAEMKAEKGRLPSQTVTNPKSGVNAITLRSGRRLQGETSHPTEQSLENSSDDHAGSGAFKYADLKEFTENSLKSAYHNTAESACSTGTDFNKGDASPPLPFPTELKRPKKNLAIDKDLLKLFSKVEISIPLLDAIQQIPKYAKFLKELCTTRRGGSTTEQVNFRKNVAVISNCDIGPKCEDRGTFSISCIIGNVRINNCMLDLGSALNVIPYELYRTLQIGPLHPTNLIVQFANRTCAKPEDIVVDVLVRVEELVFLADFYVLKTEVDDSNEDLQVLLGRPFMVTVRTMINY